jgi:hypothetical protein
MVKKPETKVVYRSAEDGKFVTEKYAERHPRTTEKEHRPAPKQTPSKKGK